MQLHLRSGGQRMAIDMERAGDQSVVIGEYTYRPLQIARKVRRLATQMWGTDLAPGILEQRLIFEALEGGVIMSPWSDSGSFSPASGSVVSLGRWDEDGSVGIALHELAHEMHMRSGGYDSSDGVLREALSLLAEREAGLRRTFEREPYYTASNLINQLCELSAFSRQSFTKRWGEIVSLTNDVGLSDLVNFYLDKSERFGLGRWLKRYSDNLDLRDAMLNHIAAVTLRYSLSYRRHILEQVVQCSHEITPEQFTYVLESISTLDRRYPNDDLDQIIDFCFAPHTRQRRRMLALG
ncbi:hypothetical protein K2Z83_24355 [Oscillochloris sp. ZM17-4]|uniref:hypothetical protein n=1 Tax=Oscillochloris sp. ZM17-4 TaxID=2866714 RepID=UPI001C737A5A|nr:hypothetical protein [Oscillochloris sp. ZM17-4]MBX0330794.1 hypothetical protein [Oscillochloris sp. ZM17-4]